MIKRTIIAVILLTVLCFNGTMGMEVDAFGDSIFVDEKAMEYYEYLLSTNYISYDASEVVTLSTGQQGPEQKRKFNYITENGYVVTYYLSFYDATGLAFTPNGTDVSDFSLTNNYYFTRRYTDEHPEIAKRQMREMIAAIFPDAIYISEATSAYNCHSYAWYSQNTLTNTVWINSPNVYYHAADMSYERVYTPRVGDIICYYDLDEEAMFQNIHSGIVVGFSGETSNNVCGNSNTVIVRSKWGHFPLYEHKGDECLYTSPYGGYADEVRYYRPRTNASYTLSSSMNDLPISRTINGSGSITDKYGMYELNVTDAGQYTIIIQSDDALSNGLYDANMNPRYMTSSKSGTGNYAYAANLSAGRYYLRTAYTDTTNSGTISITIEPHSHSYDWWTYYNHSTHIESCCCGLKGTATAAHSIKASEVVDSKANCLGCGRMLDLRYDIAEVTPDSALKVSVNGSYILPSGIIVLVDEDVGAYLNGTLVFYDRDNLPVTQ